MGRNSYRGCCEFKSCRGGVTAIKLFDQICPSPQTEKCCSQKKMCEKLDTIECLLHEVLEGQQAITDILVDTILQEIYDTYDLLYYCCDEEQRDLDTILSLL